MTAIYKTKITLTYTVTVKAETSAEAEQLVDSVLSHKPVVAIVSGSRKLVGKPDAIVRAGVHWQKHI